MVSNDCGTRNQQWVYGILQKSSHSVSAVVLAGEGQNMERDYDYSSCCFAEDLEDPSVVGKTAGERAVKKLNPKRPASADIPVIYSPRVSSSLIGHLANALNGNSIARGTSFLKTRWNSKFSHPALELSTTLIDREA